LRPKQEHRTARFSEIAQKNALGFWRAAVGIDGRRRALRALSLFRVEILIRFRKQLLNSFAITTVNRNTNARGEARRFIVVGQDLADAIGDTASFVLLGFGKNEGKFVAAVTRGSIDGAAVDAENIGEAADGAAADEMAVTVVDNFQTIDIEKQNGERASGAIRAFGLVLKDIKQAAVVREAGERIADGHVMDAFKEASVIEERATQRHDITQNHEGLGEKEGSVHQAPGLCRGELSGDVEPGGGINGAVERGIFDGQTAAVPDKAHEKNRTREQLFGIGKEGAGMARDHFWGQAAEDGGDGVRQPDHGEESTNDFAERMTGTRNEPFDEQRQDQEKRQDEPAKPPGERSPMKPRMGIRQELKKKNAGGGKDSAGKEKSGAKNQGNTILGSLEANEG